VSNYKDSFGQPKPPEQAMAARLTTLHGRDCAKALMLVDAALAASAPQKEEREPCSACEGEQFDGFICDRCGREHHVAADGTWWSTWPAPAQETER
jgi:hypothetical protein